MAETVALIVAAGRGERAGGGIPKQYRSLAGKPVLRWAIEAFRGHPQVDAVQTVIRRDDRERYDAAAIGLGLDAPVNGGATRADSVRNGLDSLGRSLPRRVLIHDGARPLVSASLISRVIGALDNADAAAPLLPVADTLRRRTAVGYETVPRDDLLRAQTPQGFRFDKIWDAHRRFGGEPVTDDLALAERANLTIAAVPGEETNLKITTADDFMTRGKTCALLSARCAHRNGFRRASFRTGRSCLALRCEGPAHGRTRRTFRC